MCSGRSFLSIGLYQRQNDDERVERTHLDYPLSTNEVLGRSLTQIFVLKVDSQRRHILYRSLLQVYLLFTVLRFHYLIHYIILHGPGMNHLSSRNKVTLDGPYFLSAQSLRPIITHPITLPLPVLETSSCPECALGSGWCVLAILNRSNKVERPRRKGRDIFPPSDGGLIRHRKGKTRQVGKVCRSGLKLR